MKQKISFSQIVANGCVSFCSDADCLKEFYLVSKKGISDEFKAKKEKFKYAFLISEKLDTLFKIEREKRDSAINDILEFEICSGKKIGDVIDSIDIAENNNIVYSLNYSIKNIEKFDANVAKSAKNEANYLLKTAKSSTLSNAIVIFEQFLSYVYSALIYEHKDKYFENKNIQIKNLLDKSIDEILDEEISKIVECDMYDSFLLLNKIFEKEKISSNYAINVLNEFKEAYFRRNMYIHNDGYVNQQYLNKIENTKYQLNDYLKCDDNYLKKLIVVLKELIVFVSISLINKIDPNQNAYSDILDYCFETLKKEEYDFCEFVYRYNAQNKYLDNTHKMVSQANLLICLKETKQKDKFDEEINLFDVTGSDSDFLIAKKILEEKFEEATNLILDNYEVGTTSRKILSWPLFKNYRETEFFKKLTEMKSDDFNSVEILDSGNQ